MSHRTIPIPDWWRALRAHITAWLSENDRIVTELYYRNGWQVGPAPTSPPIEVPTHQLLTETADMSALPRCTDCDSYDDLNQVGRCEPCQKGAEEIERVLRLESQTITMARIHPAAEVLHDLAEESESEPRSARHAAPVVHLDPVAAEYVAGRIGSAPVDKRGKAMRKLAVSHLRTDGPGSVDAVLAGIEEYVRREMELAA